MQTDFSRFSYSSHIFWFRDILSKKSKFGACAVTGYCSFKWEWASEKQREEKSGKGSTSLSRSPQLQTVFSQLFSIYFPYDLGAWSATCRSLSEQSAQTVSFIIPLWWWNHIFALLIDLCDISQALCAFSWSPSDRGPVSLLQCNPALRPPR